VCNKHFSLFDFSTIKIPLFYCNKKRSSQTESSEKKIAGSNFQLKRGEMETLKGRKKENLIESKMKLLKLHNKGRAMSSLTI
jgi:hypothetical protein